MTYVPPREAEEVRRLMREFIVWLNSGPMLAWPPVLRAIAAHFYFISIHPFGDGNGRTARAIESYLLYQAQVNVVGFYSLSNFYYRNRAGYVEMLDHVRFRSGGNLTPLLRFAVDGLVEELETVRDEVIRAVTEIIFFDYAYTRPLLARTSKASYRLSLLVGSLRTPASISDIRNGRHPMSVAYVDLSQRTLDRDLRALEGASLVVRQGDQLSLNFDVMQQFTR